MNAPPALVSKPLTPPLDSRMRLVVRVLDMNRHVIGKREGVLTPPWTAIRWYEQKVSCVKLIIEKYNSGGINVTGKVKDGTVRIGIIDMQLEDMANGGYNNIEAFYVVHHISAGRVTYDSCSLSPITPEGPKYINKIFPAEPGDRGHKTFCFRA